MAKCNTEHKYLKPLEFFVEFVKGVHDCPLPVFVGLYFSDKYVTLAITDDFCIRANYFGQFPRDKTLLDNLVKQLQRILDNDHVLRSIIVSSDNSVELDLEGKGIIGSSNNSVATSVNIPTLIDKLCEKGNFESLKYTYLKDNFKSWRADLSGITLPMWHPLRRRRDLKTSPGAHMLQVGIDFLNTLIDRKNFEGKEDS